MDCFCAVRLSRSLVTAWRSFAFRATGSLLFFLVDVVLTVLVVLFVPALLVVAAGIFPEGVLSSREVVVVFVVFVGVGRALVAEGDHVDHPSVVPLALVLSVPTDWLDIVVGELGVSEDEGDDVVVGGASSLMGVFPTASSRLCSSAFHLSPADLVTTSRSPHPKPVDIAFGLGLRLDESGTHNSPTATVHYCKKLCNK